MMKCPGVCLVALALLSSLCAAQYPQKPNYQQKPQPPAKDTQQTQQVKQELGKPLTWSYPAPPQPDSQPDIPFELRYPVAASTVAVECRESAAVVEVKKDMFGVGQLVNAADLTLGTCNAVAEDNAAQVFIFEAQLHDCGSSLAMTADALVYTFILNYNPQSLGNSPVVRTSSSAVIVECHYPRKHNVSSLPLDPLWIPYSAVKMADEFLSFTLRLMTDDFQYERPSYQYVLGDMIYIEATVKQFFHAPLRVYVDNCVATLSTDPSSSPRYAFIENNGCLVDGRITGSSSKFLARTAENKLQFLLEAFRFNGAGSSMIYITCHLKATLAVHALDAEYRACSYVNGWLEASGHDAACGSCESGSFGPVGGPASTLPSGVSTIGSGFGGGAAAGKGGHTPAKGQYEASPVKYGGGAATGGYGAATGGYGAATGGYGAATGGYGTGAATGGYGYGAAPSGYGAPAVPNPGRKYRDVINPPVAWEGFVTLGISVDDKVEA